MERRASARATVVADSRSVASCDSGEVTDERRVTLDLTQLNPDQRDAVEYSGGPLLIVAGAGSGKTRVLTHRVAQLIANGVHPMNILAITFTNKAAGEMRSRVKSLVGDVADRMWVSTFHSACVRILRMTADKIGYNKNFTIYDSSDSLRLVGQIIRDLNLDPKRFPAKGAQARISLWKNELVEPAGATDTAFGPYDTKYAEIYTEYQHRLRRAEAMDFDDLLVNVVMLFRRNPDTLAAFQDRFKHVLVDEYQDTNLAQNEIVLLLGRLHHNVCVVGDTDQSIYAFRGADYRNILQFERAFPDVYTVVLAQNYRSTQVILDAANAVISNNVERKPKELWTDVGSGDKIVRYYAEDEDEEARFVVSELQRLHRHEAVNWREIAVFYRTNAQSRVIEEFLIDADIPYRVIGGTKFYDRKEVKDAVAYLRCVLNPADEVSIRRVINVPRRGVGDTSLDKVAALAELRNEDTHEAAGRIENLEELIGAAEEFPDANDFLEKVSLVSDTDEIAGDDKVMMMTLHSAKGLEFPTVFIIGMEEGVFPHNRSLLEPAALEEERRLAYVGITRAERRLFVSHAWSRSLHGSRQYNPPSRFLDEIPLELLDRRGSVDTGADEGRGHLRERSDWARTPVPDFRGGSSRGTARGSRSVTSAASDALRPAAREPRIEHTFAIGDDVVHPVFGEGVIINIEGTGEKAEAEVRFVERGTKRLALAWAPLTKR
ncbi:MAG: ATP-dependent DNA helicase PcrA [Actinobacteria bacterium]|nr:ATP-dependent DNA helicase PcrA [Actinomycetota bacterium]